MSQSYCHYISYIYVILLSCIEHFSTGNLGEFDQYLAKSYFVAAYGLAASTDLYIELGMICPHSSISIQVIIHEHFKISQTLYLYIFF